MNPNLQGILDLIQSDVRDKAKPDPDPEKVGAADLATILEDTVVNMDYLFTAVNTTPQGFQWITVPGAPAFPTTPSPGITETASEFMYMGEFYAMDPATTPQPYAATGKHRLDYSVVNLNTINIPEFGVPSYGVIYGTEVLEDQPVAAPTLPLGYVMIRPILVTDSAATPQPSGIFKSISINGQPPVTPDPSGHGDLTIDSNAVPYIPADATWWAPILSAGATVVKEALDYLQDFVKTLSATVTTLQGTVSGHTTSINTNTAAIATKADKDLAINVQTANYVLALTDRANMVAMDMATANTITIPPAASVAFPTGTQIIISQDGIGQTTIFAGSGVSIVSYGAKFKIAGQWAAVTIVKRGTNTWQVMGTTVN